MTDHFESEVQKFVSRQNGGDLTPNIVYGMLRAVDADGEARHEESMARLKAVEDAMSAHVVWTEKESLPRLAAVEAAVQDLGCIRGEHTALHENHLALEHKHAPRRAEDPKSATFDEQREGEEMRVSFRVGRYILAALVVIALTVCINYFVLYHGQRTQLATSKGNAAALTVLVRQQHQDTIDLLNLLRSEHSTPTPAPTP